MRGWLIVLGLLASGRAEADRVRLKVGTLAIDGSRYMLDMTALAREIERRTGGDVQITWISGGQAGDEKEMVEQIRHGALAGGALSETGLVALVPEMAAWQYPGLVTSYDEVDRATAAVDATTRERFARREIQFLMWADLGFAHLFSTEPIPNLRDVLVRASPWLTVPIDGKLTAEITSSRARAWALPPLYMMAIGAAKVKQMTALRYRYVPGALVIGDRAWARLSTAQQAKVREVCREWEPKIRTSWRAETERGLSALAKSGVRTYTSPATEIAGFAEASRKSREAHATGEVAKLAALIVTAIGSR
jgi:TRAP-type transport system periplasmic protein